MRPLNSSQRDHRGPLLKYSRPPSSLFHPDCRITSRTLSGLGRLTPPTKPIAFPLHVVSITFNPDFANLSVSPDSPRRYRLQSAAHRLCRVFADRPRREERRCTTDAIGRAVMSVPHSTLMLSILSARRIHSGLRTSQTRMGRLPDRSWWQH